jgi:ABC-type amino acid transport system permease subunit
MAYSWRLLATWAVFSVSFVIVVMIISIGFGFVLNRDQMETMQKIGFWIATVAYIVALPAVATIPLSLLLGRTLHDCRLTLITEKEKEIASTASL